MIGHPQDCPNWEKNGVELVSRLGFTGNYESRKLSGEFGSLGQAGF